MWRDHRDAVLDMLQASDEALQFTADGIDYCSDKLRLRAVERCLSVLGEAAKRVPDSIRAQHPHIPGRAMAGLRDVLVHDYFGVDLDVVRDVVENELPALRMQLQALINAEGWMPEQP